MSLQIKHYFWRMEVMNYKLLVGQNMPQWQGLIKNFCRDIGSRKQKQKRRKWTSFHGIKSNKMVDRKLRTYFC